MSHHKYHTDALVIGVSPRSEGDLAVTLITRELGLVRGVATGARLEKSKNRMSLIEGTQIKASLVKGKEVWRLTNVVFIESFYPLLRESKKQKVVWSVHLLLRKIAPRDVLPTTLFSIVNGLWKSVIERPIEYLRAIECIALLNIVHDLGYLGSDPRWQKYLGVYEPQEEVLEEMRTLTKEASMTINNSLKATHL